MDPSTASNVPPALDINLNEATYFCRPTSSDKGIPEATFFEDVPAIAKMHGSTETIARLNDLHQRYKFWEAKYIGSKQSLTNKIPDLRRTVEVVQGLKEVGSQNDVDDSDLIMTNFELSDQLYVQAALKKDSHAIGLWLGAGVMVEYTYDEAIALLNRNLETAQNSLDKIKSDLEFLREQMNVTEVNMTRIYNYDIAQKRMAQKSASALSQAPEVS